MVSPQIMTVGPCDFVFSLPVYIAHHPSSYLSFPTHFEWLESDLPSLDGLVVKLPDSSIIKVSF